MQSMAVARPSIPMQRIAPIGGAMGMSVDQSGLPLQTELRAFFLRRYHATFLPDDLDPARRLRPSPN
jgi:hypothetical protein